MHRHRIRQLQSDDDWFSPSTDLMLSLFAIIAVVLSYVSYQKTLLATDYRMAKEDQKTVAEKLAQTEQKLAKALAELEETRSRELKSRQERESGQLEITKAAAAQNQLAETIASVTGFQVIEGVGGKRTLANWRKEAMMTLGPDPQNPLLFRLQFGADLLFQENKAEVTEDGKTLIADVGKAMVRQISGIQEVQIQGHADNIAEDDYNMRLAFDRGHVVMNLLRASGISPADNLVSVTSFGEFCPVDRHPGDNFNARILLVANSTETQRQKNRRVEVLLFYGSK